MTELYLLANNEWSLVLRIRNARLLGYENRMLLVKYSIVPYESPFCIYQRIALLGEDLVGVSAYLLRQNIQRLQYLGDTAFCERLLLHWVKTPQDNQSLQDFPKELSLFPLGQANALKFQGIVPLDKVEEEIRGLNPPRSSAGDTSSGQSQCS